MRVHSAVARLGTVCRAANSSDFRLKGRIALARKMQFGLTMIGCTRNAVKFTTSGNNH